MAEITVALIKQLRDKTSAGMMDCKAALKETDGDLEAAETALRKKNLMDAGKKAGRDAKEGVIASRVAADGKFGVMIEVNCETDFVAKNDNFREFVEQILDHVEKSPEGAALDAILAENFVGDESQTLDLFVKDKAGQLGENMGLTRWVKLSAAGEGSVSTYIHMQGKVGVLIEVGAGKADSVSSEKFLTLVKDLTLHIAAASPICITREEVPESLIETEKDIFRDQMKDKPADKIEMIIKGKMNKFYGTHALLEQAFVKDADQTIKKLVESVGKDIGDELSINRFERFAVGEEFAS
ncbi:translation elongation factor Ts [bacterium]|nr:translation elongation factor Ts [bacterium]